MARLYLIIDGYNLMHAAGFGRSRYDRGDLERCRNRLIQQLEQKLNPTVLADTTIVFDGGSEGEESLTSVQPNRMAVMFSGKESDADTQVEALLSNHSSPKQTLVVSSDHRLHKAAARRKATAIDSDAFWDLLEDPESDVFRSGLPVGSSGDDTKPEISDAEEFQFPDDFLDFDVNRIR